MKWWSRGHLPKQLLSDLQHEGWIHAPDVDRALVVQERVLGTPPNPNALGLVDLAENGFELGWQEASGDFGQTKLPNPGLVFGFVLEGPLSSEGLKHLCPGVLTVQRFDASELAGARLARHRIGVAKAEGEDELAHPRRSNSASVLSWSSR